MVNRIHLTEKQKKKKKLLKKKKKLPRVSVYFFCVHALAWLCRVRFFATLWVVACQGSPPLGFFRQEYWSGLPFPPPGGLPEPGIKPTLPASPVLQVSSLLLSHPGSPSASLVLSVCETTRIYCTVRGTVFSIM